MDINSGYFVTFMLPSRSSWAYVSVQCIIPRVQYLKKKIVEFESSVKQQTDQVEASFSSYCSFLTVRLGICLSCSFGEGLVVVVWSVFFGFHRKEKRNKKTLGQQSE